MVCAALRTRLGSKMGSERRSGARRVLLRYDNVGPHTRASVDITASTRPLVKALSTLLRAESSSKAWTVSLASISTTNGRFCWRIVVRTPARATFICSCTPVWRPERCLGGVVLAPGDDHALGVGAGRQRTRHRSAALPGAVVVSKPAAMRFCASARVRSPSRSLPGGSDGHSEAAARATASASARRRSSDWPPN